LRTSQPQLFPHTPTEADDEPNPPTASGLREHQSLRQQPETPSTKSKRKRDPRDVTDHGDNEDDRNRNLVGNEAFVQSTIAVDDPFAHSQQPLEYSRKVGKTSIYATPGQNSTKRLKSQAVPFPTPLTGDYMSGDNGMISRPRLLPSLNMSPTPGRFNDMPRRITEGDSDLATTILELIRSENLHLKGSTEIQIRHEIGLRFNALRQYEETISELKDKLDKMEMIARSIA
jgi:hypothetical protein